jgi:hypothetical protein
LAAPLRVQRAVARLWATNFRNENWALRSAPSSDLARECHAAYGAPKWCARSSSDGERKPENPGCVGWHLEKLKIAFRNVGAPWYGGAGPDALTISEIIHFGYEGGRSTRTYVVPLDRAPENLPRAEFGPCRIERLSEAELADILQTAALERHCRGHVDIGKFSQFKWLLVNESVDIQPAAQRDIRTRIWSTTLDGFGLVDVYRRCFPPIVERALMTLLLHPWEDRALYASFDTWKPFDVPWIYAANSDPFEAPRPVPDFTSLSWRPYATPEGDIIEHDQPDSREFEEIVFDNYETECRTTWTTLEMVCPLEQICCPAFNPLIEHFLLRAWREEGIDQLIMHMTAIDAAIGNRELNKNRPKEKKYVGLTKALGARMCALLSDPNAGSQFDTLYDRRSEYIHGRLGAEGEIKIEDLNSARRMARRVARGVLEYAVNHPDRSRDDMLADLDGRAP